MRFASPILLLLLLVVPIMIWHYNSREKKNKASIKFSNIDLIKQVKPAESRLLKWLFPVMRILIVVLLIIAFARPQAGQKGEDVSTKGIDIMLVLDTSSSMKAEDFKPRNRLFAAKQVVREFIKARKNDRIGVVVFSALSYTQCPLTLDYGAVLDFLEKVEIGMTNTDGTAIGVALANAVNRIKDSKAKSKTIILLTDGCNNRGEIDPLTAAKVAEAMGIKVYTIGAGQPGGAMVPIDDPIFGRRYVKIADELDENLLSAIAQATGGLYFRATNQDSLRSIYKKIDDMEKTEIKITEYTDYSELFMWFLLPALIIFCMEILLKNTYFMKIP